MPTSVDELIDKLKKSNDFFYKAKVLIFLKKDKQISNKELSKITNIKPSYLCHILRLNRLPELVVDSYYSNLVSISHLFILSRLKEQKQMIATFEKILKNNLTVGQTEYLIREILYGVKSDGKYFVDEEIMNKIKEINQNNNVSIKIVQSRVKSKIIIEMLGSLAKTSPLLKELLKKLTGVTLAKDQ